MQDYMNRDDLNDEERARISEYVTDIAALRASISRNHNDISTLWNEYNELNSPMSYRAYGDKIMLKRRDPRVIRFEIKQADISICITESAISELRYGIVNVYSQQARRLAKESHNKPRGTILLSDKSAPV